MRNLLVTAIVLVTLLCVVYLARGAPPTGASCSNGVLASSGTIANGVLPKAVTGHGQSSFTFEIAATAGTGTVGLVACCTGLCDVTTGQWGLIGTTGSLATTTPLVFTVAWPGACLYSLQVTAATGLSGNASVACGGITSG
jgi:hypothetical protein